MAGWWWRTKAFMGIPYRKSHVDRLGSIQCGLPERGFQGAAAPCLARWSSSPVATLSPQGGYGRKSSVPGPPKLARWSPLARYPTEREWSLRGGGALPIRLSTRPGRIPAPRAPRTAGFLGPTYERETG